MEYREIMLSDNLKKQYAFNGMLDIKAYRSEDGCNIMISKDEGVIHISISREDRIPT